MAKQKKNKPKRTSFTSGRSRSSPTHIVYYQEINNGKLGKTMERQQFSSLMDAENYLNNIDQQMGDSVHAFDRNAGTLTQEGVKAGVIYNWWIEETE
jgi:hypothetical protein